MNDFLSTIAAGKTAADRAAVLADKTTTQTLKDAAATAASAAAASATATANDRTATGADRTATADDRTQTGADRTAIGIDRTAVATDKTTVLGYRNDAAASAGLTAADVITTAASVTAAGSSASAASTSATLTAADRTTTLAYLNAASASATSASDSAAAAATAIVTYPDTTTGLAAVAEGAYFLVAGAGTVYASRYRKVGGVATGQMDYASKAAIDAAAAHFRDDTSASEVLYSVVNKNGDMLFAFRNSLQGLDVPNLRTVNLAASSVSTLSLTASSGIMVGATAINNAANPENIWQLQAANGDIITKVDTTGKLHAGSATVHGDLTVLGQIYGANAVVPVVAAPFATIAAADIAVLNAWTIPGLPTDVAPPPVLSTDTATYGVRRAHISGGIAITGSRVWAIGMGKLGVTQITGYITGTTLTVVSVDNKSAISDDYPPAITGAGVTAGTTITARAISTNFGPGTYTVSTSQTVGSAGSPVAMTVTDDGADGAEGAAAYGFLRYTDDLAGGIWKECLYFLPPVSWTDAAGDTSLGTLPDGRLWIAVPMTSASPLARASYGWIINNPEAVSGSFEIGRANYIGKGTAMEPTICGGTLYLNMDENTGSNAQTNFGKLTFTGRDGASFTSISYMPKVPSPYGNFCESSAVPITGGRWIGFNRSSNGTYQTISTADAASWGAMTTWKSISGFDTPVSRAKFALSPSGRIAAIFNNDPTLRRNMTVALSEDSGLTYPWSVVIESRSLTAQSPSYPAVAFSGGYIYVITDFGRLANSSTGTGIGKRMIIYRVLESLVRAGTATELDVTKFTAFT